MLNNCDNKYRQKIMYIDDEGYVVEVTGNRAKSKEGTPIKVPSDYIKYFTRLKTTRDR